MPGDIASPDLRFARPKTSPGVTPQTSGGKPEATDNTEEYHVELLEYEWPDLPPIPQMKDAITRERVSKGISYILPIDKSMISINNHYRTDLRAMFQEPYASDKLRFDENKLKLSAKIHFDTNTGDTKWTRKLLKSVPVEINSESDKIRKLYARSAPAGGSRRSNFDLDQMKTRSNLYLPMKTRAHPEAQKLRKEVEKIIQSVQEDGEDYNDDKFKQSEEEISTAKLAISRPSLAPHMTRDSIMSNASSHSTRPRLKLTAERFNSYEQLQKTKPPKPQIPEILKSRYLSAEKNQAIWEWLHHGEEMTEFEFFLSVCG
ncbi:uncharacterized protein LOC133180900 [Saccostrea echinata]|uniref:uncharacterized protein LOC133180900 n=1 Tax=Saccostrea echinata TaxID=191078 RepID=UPI002A7F163B|nr:uncharacterized protein LOC133180900 [Saccostrea echinata]XP_061171336.1 uncharacterized protein LOC133180900 [Saccostrea echinata]XP_061171337.1 uncharacterized protein LOC133180900 [Saccostrea echinata]XP_061171338.1 uncharacterized protein LOC133180900 [Saccostrea echinata]